MNNEKISNEMADRLAEELHHQYFKSYHPSTFKRIWKNADLIEESALEKARKQHKALISLATPEPILRDECELTRVAWEKAIIELEARIKELDEGKS